MSRHARNAHTSLWMDRAHPTYVIAEAGVNHNGSVEMAHTFVEVAAQTGADAVKFQTFTPELLVTEKAALAEYQAQRVTRAKSQRAMISSLVLPPEAHAELREHAREVGIDFLSTAFDIPSLDLLLALDVPFVKVPSGELTNLPYLRDVAGRDADVVVSTGMADLQEVGEALDVLTAQGLPLDRVTVLHCTTAYPTPMDAVNLTAMRTMQETFGVAVGYSDHTRGIEVATAAVALGATVIEKHLTLSQLLPGPDHAASLEPAEFETMVRAIRNLEIALGDGRKVQEQVEASNALVARRSIVAARPIELGEIFSADNLTVKRPAAGVSPMRWDEAMGRPAQRRYEADEMIDL